MFFLSVCLCFDTSFTAASFISLESSVIPRPFHLIQASIFISIFLSPSFSLWINNLPHLHCCASVLLLVKAPPRNSITQLLFYDVVLSADDGFIISSLRLTSLSQRSLCLLFHCSRSACKCIRSLSSPVLLVISTAICSVAELIVPSDCWKTLKPRRCDPVKDSIVLCSKGQLASDMTQYLCTQR